MSDDDGLEGAERVLREVFGFEAFRGGQADVVRCLLDGRSALAVFPTGGGKSLCYQIPAVLTGGVTVVISPLIALMKDQVDYLVGLGIPAARWDPAAAPGERAEVQGALASGALRLLYVAPETFVSGGFRELLDDFDIRLLAIDEAHCLSEWGHNFRPDYLKVSAVAKAAGVNQFLALTATATPEVCLAIREEFSIAESAHFQTSFRRPNLRYSVERCCGDDRSASLVDALRSDGATPAIVYVTLQETAERLAGLLRREGIPARPYHAGLRGDHREEVQDGFMAGAIPVVVATIAFGMGIDKGDVRTVVHYNLPKSLENYAQESGRAGRDGAPSRCVLLACGDDVTVLENFVYGDTPSDAAVRSVVESVLGQGAAPEVSRHALSVAYDIRPQVLGTLLAQLELEGLIEPESQVYRKLRVRFLRDEAALLAGYDPARKALLQAVLRHGETKWYGVEIEPAAAAEALEVPEDVVRAALDELEAAGEVVLRRSGVIQRYRRCGEAERVSAVVERVQTMFKRREARDLARVASVVAFAEGAGCLVRELVGYFGEVSEGECGRCSGCAGDGGGELPAGGAGNGELAAEDVESIRGLIDERHASLRTPRQLARFLCGIHSPAAWRARLSRDDRFGLLAAVPFRDVLAFVGEMNLA